MDYLKHVARNQIVEGSCQDVWRLHRDRGVLYGYIVSDESYVSLVQHDPTEDRWGLVQTWPFNDKYPNGKAKDYHPLVYPHDPISILGQRLLDAGLWDGRGVFRCAESDRVLKALEQRAVGVHDLDIVYSKDGSANLYRQYLSPSWRHAEYPFIATGDIQEAILANRRFNPFYGNESRYQLNGLALVCDQGKVTGYAASDGYIMIYRDGIYDPDTNQAIVVPPGFMGWLEKIGGCGELKITGNDFFIRLVTPYGAWTVERYRYPDYGDLVETVQKKEPLGEWVLTPQQKRMFLEWGKTIIKGRNMTPMQIRRYKTTLEFKIGDQSLCLEGQDDTPYEAEMRLDGRFFRQALHPSRRIGSDISFVDSHMMEVQNPNDTVLIMGMEPKYDYSNRS